MNYQEWMRTSSRHGTPRLHQNPNDPAYDMLYTGHESTPKVYREGCYICKDMEFARMGMPLCNLCCFCASLDREGHIPADGATCDDCGHQLCEYCVNLPPQIEPICTCNTPCCEVDVGVGIITCQSAHCPTHGETKDHDKSQIE